MIRSQYECKRFEKRILTSNSWMFPRKGLIGMLEASDFEKIDQMFPFFGAVTDNLCGNEDVAQVKEAFNLYSELLLMLHQYLTFPGWIASNLVKLNSKMVESKKTDNLSL